MQVALLPPTPPASDFTKVRPLPSRFSSAVFSRGILVCPESESGRYLASVPSERVPRSVTRIGEAGLFHVSKDPGPRRFHTWLDVRHAETPHAGPGPTWDDSWTLAPTDALAVFDHKGTCHGHVTDVAGTYLVRSRILDGSESPDDEFYVAPGWFLEVTMLDPVSAQPVNARWWGFGSR